MDDSPSIASEAEVEQSQRKPLEQKAKYRATPVFSNLKLVYLCFSLIFSSCIYLELAYRESRQESCIMRSCGKMIVLKITNPSHC